MGKGSTFTPHNLVHRIKLRCFIFLHSAMICFVFYISCILSVGVALQVDCEPGWTMCPQSGTCVKVFKDGIWDDARHHCQSEGGDLVKILDSEMNELISGMTSSEDAAFAFIGLKFIGTTETFQWADETTEANYVNIPESENATVDDVCVVINSALLETIYWQKENCLYKIDYVCERTAVSFCPEGWYPNSHAGTCIRVVRHSLPWRHARQYCQNRGGDLAVVLDEKVDQCLSDQTVTLGWRFNKYAWIGLNDIDNRGKFKWLDNFVDEMNYTNWSGKESDSQSESNCVTINQTSSKTPFWDIADCKQSLPFICEKFADCKYEQHGMFCPKPCTSALCADDQAACNRRNGICQNACTNNKYGEECLAPCSPHCKGPHKACHFITASCLFGCEDGYKDMKCETECSNHTYGANCSEVCSPHCGGQNKSCDYRDGSCLSGCDDGYTGLRCETESKLTPILGPKYTTAAIVSAATFASVVILTCFCLWILIKKTELQEMSTLGEEQHMGQDEDMGQGEDIGQDENMGQEEHMGQDENMAQGEDMGQ